MRHRSKKNEERYKLRRPLVARLLSERPWCEACPVFARHDEKVTYRRLPSVDVHELVSRGRGGSILDESNCICVCRQCHSRIGRYPALAESLGLLLPSWASEEDASEAAARRKT